MAQRGNRQGDEDQTNCPQSDLLNRRGERLRLEPAYGKRKRGPQRRTEQRDGEVRPL
jgi:hypothetical protein